MPNTRFINPEIVSWCCHDLFGDLGEIKTYDRLRYMLMRKMMGGQVEDGKWDLEGHEEQWIYGGVGFNKEAMEKYLTPFMTDQRHLGNQISKNQMVMIIEHTCHKITPGDLKIMQYVFND